MQIKPITPQNDLFYVSDVIDADLIERLNHEDLEKYEKANANAQDFLPRKRLYEQEDSLLQEIKINVQSKLNDINSILNSKIKKIDVVFWKDFSGFSMNTHIDRPKIDAAMQIYLFSPNKNYGTVFYHANESDVEERNDDQKWWLINKDLEIKHAFKSIQNTGYIMFNHKLHAHGVPSTVPKDKFRLSCYCPLQL